MLKEMVYFQQLDNNVSSFIALENSPDGKLNEQLQTHELSSVVGGMHHEQHQHFMVDFERLHNLRLDVVSPPFQSGSEEIKKVFDDAAQPDFSAANFEPEKERPFAAASLKILTNYGSRLRRLNGEKIKIPRFEVKGTEIVKEKLSTNEILKLAAEKFIHSYHPKNKDQLGLRLSEENNRDMELVLHLLSAAEKVSEMNYGKAKKILKKCKKLSFDKGNPVQRLVHYFSAALRERIDQERGRNGSKGFGRKLSNLVEETLSKISSFILAFEKAVPFSHVSQFTRMQFIIEKVEGASKVHIIDLQIRMGMQYTVLIQSLAARSECPVELLKITAVATKCKEAVEATGKRLRSFAQSFNLIFDFNVVEVEDILDLHESLFRLDDDEAVAVYSEYFLMLMIEKPDRLQSLMGIIRKINPCVMVVTEVEANHNSPVFVNRFSEALFYYGAFFDAFEDCLKDDEASRMVIESMIFSQGIKNVVAAEEEERTIRMVKINVWRAFFARFGMFEVELSRSSMYQATLLLKKFPCGNSCTLEMDEKSLILGWKGTPTNSLSAWVFY